MKTILFDIETGPLPDEELKAMLPPFDPGEVKVGNLKDPEKIAAKVSEARANHWRDFQRKAALDALTGRVLAIGVMDENGQFSVLGDAEEKQTLMQFWGLCRKVTSGGNWLIGFNTHAFDLPFLIRRSLKHGVAATPGLRKGRYWSPQSIDLREEWQLGDRQAHGSLDTIARHLGVGQKNGNGEDFAKLWRENREKAVLYLHNDLELTSRIAAAMGLVPELAPSLRIADAEEHHAQAAPDQPCSEPAVLSL
jgi:DNA polymerase elongation subunit (family B)